LRTSNAFEATFKIVESVFDNKNTFKRYIRKYARGYQFLVVDMSIQKDDNDYGSDSSYDSVADILSNIKRRVFYLKGDINLKTRCFPDHLRSNKEKKRYGIN
jgi:hypothetical protein